MTDTDFMPRPLPLLPPAYRLVQLFTEDAPFEAACSAAESGRDGDFFWSDLSDRLDCAILLHPELPAARAGLVAHTAMVGLGDAIGALAPPAIAVEFGWPDRLYVNGAIAGGIRVATAATANAHDLPDWQVLGVTVAMHGDRSDPSPGLKPETTTLYDEGAVDVTAVALAESLSRHLLTWVHRWHEDGFAPISESWLGRAVGYRQDIAWRLPSGPISGHFVGLDDEGGLLLGAPESEFATIPLGPALRQPSWSL